MGVLLFSRIILQKYINYVVKKCLLYYDAQCFRLINFYTLILKTCHD